MEPAKLDDRELGCIDFFLFCCLLSSGLVWPTSWAILALSWAILASSWTILAPSGAIRAPSWAPKASPSLPRLNQTVPRGAHRPPEAPRAKNHENLGSSLGSILKKNTYFSPKLLATFDVTCQVLDISLTKLCLEGFLLF